MDYWERIKADDRLANARRKLSMDELRMLFQHARDSLAEPPKVREVLTLAVEPLIGDFQVHRGGIAGPHPADGMTATMAMGDGAFVSFINPQSFVDGGPKWVCRYGNVIGIRYTLASLLESYDYLLSGEITTTEAIRRLRLLREGRRLLQESGE